MHHTIEIAVPTEATEGVLAELEALEGVVTLSVLHGASVKPPGDVVTVHALNRGVDAVLAVAAQARQRGPVSVSTAGLQSLLDQQAQRAIDDDVDEAPWEEFERILRHHGQLNLNFLALMGLGAAIAVAGLLSGSSPPPSRRPWRWPRRPSSHRRSSLWPNSPSDWSAAAGMPSAVRLSPWPAVTW